jgi:uncharacterized protein YxjI
MSFFDTNNYFIDEKVNMLKFENEYKVFNEQAVQIGMIKQKLSGGEKVLRLLFNKSMLPFHLEIKDANDQLQAKIATVEQKFTMLKPNFKIYNNQHAQIAEISGDWKAWNFSIFDTNKNQIGSITKKWAGVAKEFFTTADKYNVNINPVFSNPNDKIAVIASAVTIDMVLKESK